MSTFAGEIAARLQGAHARRNEREDKDMSKDESVWETEVDKALDGLRESLRHLRPGGDSQASAVSAERVVELERQLARLTERETAAMNGVEKRDRMIAELERELAQALQDREASDAAANERDGENEELRAEYQALRERFNALGDLLATAYVAREVPWSDVAAGAMTIARDGTPWMVETWIGIGAVLLRNGTKTFEKAIDRSTGETVRVLVPYVTPEQAEAAVREQLGGTEVG